MFLFHRLKLRLLFRCKFVLDSNPELHVQAFDLSLAVKHFVELCQRLLLVHWIRFHRFVQSFHGILQLPLQFIETRRSFLNLIPHERLLFIS